MLPGASLCRILVSVRTLCAPRRVLVENSEKLAVASSVLALQVAVHAELASGSQSDTIIKVHARSCAVMPSHFFFMLSPFGSTVGLGLCPTAPGGASTGTHCLLRFMPETQLAPQLHFPWVPVCTWCVCCGRDRPAAAAAHVPHWSAHALCAAGGAPCGPAVQRRHARDPAPNGAVLRTPLNQRASAAPGCRPGS